MNKLNNRLTLKKTIPQTNIILHKQKKDSKSLEFTQDLEPILSQKKKSQRNSISPENSKSPYYKF